ncbi:MAG: glycosyltransferase [Lachnospiraceae bacterium]|nr:glycosyltransferase [Lachnospiraceae bacterium]
MSTGNHITVSLCMIVKDEEAVLKRCLDSLRDLMDEIVIVDTGSSDRTKEIAREYTDLVFDFEWVNDFSKARNYAFSKATCDYIYSADADEVLDEENRKRFRILKNNLTPEIEIVQMYYCNQLENGSVYNFDRELRAKLFKRVRTFTWIEPVHETIREKPLVFDSDIEIIHRPEGLHSGRDIGIFEGLVERGERLSERLAGMYARELFIAGSDEELYKAEKYFTEIAEADSTDASALKEAICVIVLSCFRRGDYLKMYRYALKEAAMEPASEVCFILGEYYLSKGDPREASVWFYNSAFETKNILSLKYGGEEAIRKLSYCYRSLGNEEQAKRYEAEIQRLNEKL